MLRRCPGSCVFTFHSKLIEAGHKRKELATTVKVVESEERRELLERVQRVALAHACTPVPSPEQQLALLRAAQQKQQCVKLACTLIGSTYVYIIALQCPNGAMH